MINSIKGIISGLVFILISIIILQVAFIMIAVGFTDIAKGHPVINEYTGLLRYFLGIPIIVLIMSVGGYLTARIAGTKVILNTAIVGMIAPGSVLLLATQNAVLTNVGIFIFILSLLSTIAGGIYQQIRQ